MKSTYRSNIFILLIVILQILVSEVFGKQLVLMFGYKSILAVNEYLFLLVPCILFITFTGQSVRETFSLNKLPIIEILIVILIAFLSQPVAAFFSLLSGFFFKNPVVEALKVLNTIPYPILLFIMAVTPAICEEAVTRGIVLSGYKNVSRRKAAIINGIVFGIIHLSAQQFLYAFVIGILFAYLVRITNSILASSICHFTFNSIQVTMSKITARFMGVEQADTTAQMGSGVMIAVTIFYFLLAVAFTTLIVLLLIYLDKRHKRQQHESSSVAYEKNNERVQLYRDAGHEEDIKPIVAYLPLLVLVVIYVIYMINVETITLSL